MNITITHNLESRGDVEVTAQIELDHAGRAHVEFPAVFVGDVDITDDITPGELEQCIDAVWGHYEELGAQAESRASERGDYLRDIALDEQQCALYEGKTQRGVRI